MSERDLAQDETFLLCWLDGDDRGGLLGECKGRTLDTLVGLGLAALPDPVSDWGYVTLTAEGRHRLEEIAT
jgi:hypothetical protein